MNRTVEFESPAAMANRLHPVPAMGGADHSPERIAKGVALVAICARDAQVISLCDEQVATLTRTSSSDFNRGKIEAYHAIAAALRGRS